MRLYKIQYMEALGNNFIVIDSITQDFIFSLVSEEIIPILRSKEGFQRLAGRDTDFLEFDQIIVIEAPEKDIADFSVKIFNQDGSEAENCVNGMRCVARYLSDRKISIGDTVKLLIGANQVTVKKSKNDYIVENMFSLSPSEIGLNENEQVFEIEFDNKKVPCFAVSIGNPHAVIFNDELGLDVQKFGTFLQESNSFKNGVNVGFIEIKSANEINLRVFERGVGETQACGSGACAAAVACAVQKELAQELKINFHQGQVLTKVDLSDSKVLLQGSAEYRKEDVVINLQA
tara:strand:+ start:60 stop:926 length:867 start_codon:yes stop_codon:yes gene_type:complete